MRGDKLIINAALTGCVPRRADNPNVPLSEDEIVADAVRCVSAGASILHMHVRYPDETPAYEYELNDSLFRAVRSACPDVIISGSTTGRTVTELHKRAEVLSAAPDMASLTLGSMNFPTQVSVNAPATIRALATEMRERGIQPELEIFDLGDGGLRPASRRQGPAGASCIREHPAWFAGHCQRLARQPDDDHPCAATPYDLGSRRHRPFSVRGQQPRHRHGWTCQNRPRRQRVDGPVDEDGSRFECQADRTSSEHGPGKRPRHRDASRGTTDHRTQVENEEGGGTACSG